MKKKFFLSTFLLASCFASSLPLFLVSCDNKKTKPKIVEPTSKLFYSNTNYVSDEIKTNCIIGMFFVKNIDKTSDIIVEAREAHGTSYLGNLNASFIHYDQNIYLIDLQIENNDCYAENYEVEISFYLNDELIQTPSIYTINVSTQIIQINKDVTITPEWNSDYRKVDYVLNGSVAKIFHPKKLLINSDLDIEIKFTSPEIESTTLTKVLIKNTNELNLTINLLGDNFLSNPSTYYINLEITYLPSEVTKYFYYNLFFEKAGWDELVTSERIVNVVRPSDSSFVSFVFIHNFIFSGFDQSIIEATILNNNTKEEIPVKSYFIKKTGDSSQIFNFVFEITNEDELMNDVPFTISVDGTDINFCKSYYLSIVEE